MADKQLTQPTSSSIKVQNSDLRAPLCPLDCSKVMISRLSSCCTDQRFIPWVSLHYLTHSDSQHSSYASTLSVYQMEFVQTSMFKLTIFFRDIGNTLRSPERTQMTNYVNLVFIMLWYKYFLHCRNNAIEFKDKTHIVFYKIHCSSNENIQTPSVSGVSWIDNEVNNVKATSSAYSC